MNPFSNPVARKRTPTIADIQSKLAYVLSVKQLDHVKRLPECIYVQPPVSHYTTLEFSRYQEIVNTGYQHGRELIQIWREQGLFNDFLQTRNTTADNFRRVRRLSF